MVQALHHPGGTRLLLTPNRSLSWRGNLRFLAALTLLSAIIATGWALVGAWVILPFAGIELIAVAAGIYTTSRDCQRKEVLTMEGNTIRLEKGRQRRNAQWTMPRHQTHLELDEAPHPFAPARLYLHHRNEHISVGGFLNVEDTEALLNTLKGLGFTIDRHRPGPEIRLWF